MKRILISLFALGSISTWACDYLTTMSFNSPNGLVVKLLSVDANGEVLSNQIANPQLIEKVKGVAGAYRATMLSSETIFADIEGENIEMISAITDYSGLANTKFILMEDMQMTLTLSSLGAGECGLSISNPNDSTVGKALKLLDYENSESGSVIGKKYYFEKSGFSNVRTMLEVIGIKTKKK